MKIIWSDFAKETLKDIYSYYKNAAGVHIARKIKNEIYTSTRQLANHPNLGQIEECLSSLKEGHRYLVSGNYKIIYKVVDTYLLITDVFDTRQNPIKINNPNRKNT